MLYSPTLRFPRGYFDQPFWMTHCPYRTDLSDEFGIAPHTDTSFLTLLAPNDVPSLSIRTQTGKWIDAPIAAAPACIRQDKLPITRHSLHGIHDRLAAADLQRARLRRQGRRTMMWEARGKIASGLHLTLGTRV